MSITSQEMQIGADYSALMIHDNNHQSGYFMNDDELRSLTGLQIRMLNQEQLKALTPHQIASFSIAQLISLTKAQFLVLSPDQLSELDEKQNSILSRHQVNVYRSLDVFTTQVSSAQVELKTIRTNADKSFTVRVEAEEEETSAPYTAPHVHQTDSPTVLAQTQEGLGNSKISGQSQELNASSLSGVSNESLESRIQTISDALGRVGELYPKRTQDSHLRGQLNLIDRNSSNIPSSTKFQESGERIEPFLIAEPTAQVNKVSSPVQLQSSKKSQKSNSHFPEAIFVDSIFGVNSTSTSTKHLTPDLCVPMNSRSKEGGDLSSPSLEHRFINESSFDRSFSKPIELPQPLLVGDRVYGAKKTQVKANIDRVYSPSIKSICLFWACVGLIASSDLLINAYSSENDDISVIWGNANKRGARPDATLHLGSDHEIDKLQSLPGATDVLSVGQDNVSQQADLATKGIPSATLRTARMVDDSDDESKLLASLVMPPVSASASVLSSSSAGLQSNTVKLTQPVGTVGSNHSSDQDQLGQQPFKSSAQVATPALFPQRREGQTSYDSSEANLIDRISTLFPSEAIEKVNKTLTSFKEQIKTEMDLITSNLQSATLTEKLDRFSDSASHNLAKGGSPSSAKPNQTNPNQTNGPDRLNRGVVEAASSSPSSVPVFQAAVFSEKASQASIPVSASAPQSTLDPSSAPTGTDKTKLDIAKSELALKRPAIPLTETLFARVKTEKVNPLDKMSNDLEALSSSAASGINGLLTSLEASKLSKWVSRVQFSDLTASASQPSVATNSLSGGQGGSKIPLPKNAASKLGFQPLTVAVFENSENTHKATPTSTIEADGNNLTTQIFTPTHDHHKALDVFANDTRLNKVTAFAHANTNISPEFEAYKSEVTLEKDVINSNVATAVTSANLASVAVPNANPVVVSSATPVVASAVTPTTATATSTAVTPLTPINANSSLANAVTPPLVSSLSGSHLIATANAMTATANAMTAAAMKSVKGLGKGLTDTVPFLTIPSSQLAPIATQTTPLMSPASSSAPSKLATTSGKLGPNFQVVAQGDLSSELREISKDLPKVISKVNQPDKYNSSSWTTMVPSNDLPPRVALLGEDLIAAVKHELQVDKSQSKAMPYEEFKLRVKEAVSASPDVGVVSSQVGQAKAGRSLAFAGLLPQVSGYADNGARKVGRDPYLGTPEYNRNGAEYGITISQLLFDFGSTLFGVKSGKARELASLELLNSKRSEQALNCIAAFVELERAKAHLVLAQQNAASRLAIVQLVKERSELGGGARADIIRAESKYAESLSTISIVETRLNAAESAYRAVFYSTSKAIVNGPLHEFPIEGLNKTAEELAGSYPGLVQLSRLREAADSDYNSVVAKTLPNFSMVYSNNGAGYNSNAASPSNSNSILFQVKYDFYTGGADTARKQDALYKSEQARNEFESGMLQYQKVLSQTQSEIRNNEELMAARRASTNSAIDSMRAVREQFAFNRGSLLDLITVQESLIQAGNDLIDAKFDRALSRYRLLHLTSELDKMFDLNYKSTINAID